MAIPPQPVLGAAQGGMRPRFFRPKTKAGRRVIQIPDELVAALRRWKLQCPKSDEELVFAMPDGQPLCRDRLLRTRFYPALARAALRRVTFHSLRHSCASAMIAAGAAITEVQNQLGHSNPSITLGIYSHWFKNAKGCGAVERLPRIADVWWRSANRRDGPEAAPDAPSRLLHYSSRAVGFMLANSVCATFVSSTAPCQ